MGLFEKIFGTKAQVVNVPNAKYFQLINGYQPVFRTWSGSIYETDRVRSAIDARARHNSKLGVSISGSAQPSLQSRLKLAPNEWMVWSQFLYRLSSILDVKNTAFICPVVNEYGETTGIYPIWTDEWELVESNGVPFIRFKFANGKHAAIELENVGIMTRFQLKNDFFGESNNALNPIMELINIQNQGINEAVKNGASFRFMATLSNFANETDLKKERERFTRENLEGGSGVLLWPNTYKDIKQIDSKPYVVDADQMKQIDDNVFYYYGVNEDILQNKAYGDAWNAFYEGAIEPFAIQLSEVLTKMLFTLRERQLGAMVTITSNRLQYMSNSDKLQVSAQMADRGIMTRNEIREIWNLPPLPSEIGDTLPVRGEYYNLNDNNKGGGSDG